MKKTFALTVALAAASATFNVLAADPSGGITESTDPARVAQVEEHARALGFNENVATSGTSSASTTTKHRSGHKAKAHKARQGKSTPKQGESTAPQGGTTQ